MRSLCGKRRGWSGGVLARELAGKRGCRMRVMVAYEETYCFYRSVITRAIEYHRPHLQVRSVDLGVMEEALGRFDPHAVICSRPSSEYPSGGRGAWVELPADPTQKGYICLDGDHEGSLNPSLAQLLSVLDETEERLRQGDLAENC
jgi:hypothetical protein